MDALTVDVAYGLRIVHGEAAKSPLASHHLDDLISAGHEGLAKACGSYDPDRGVPFHAWCRFKILGAIRDEARRIDPLSRDKRQQIARTGRCRTDSERAPRLIGEYEPDEFAVRDIAEQAIAPLAVRQLLTVLDLRSRHVIVETYLHDRSVADVGRELGITESRVYQIRTAALRAMRSAA